MKLGFRPPPPKMHSSTRKAIAILLVMICAGLAVHWLPSPAGWILFVAIIYVGIPLMVLVLNDLIKLRMNRMLARRVEVFPPTPDEPSGMIKIEFAPLALEYVARWRRWFPWLLAMLAAVAIAGFAGRAWLPLVIVLLLRRPPPPTIAGDDWQRIRWRLAGSTHDLHSPTSSCWTFYCFLPSLRNAELEDLFISWSIY